MRDPAAPSVEAVELRRLLIEALKAADNVDQMIAIYISHALDVWRDRFDPKS